MSNCLISCFKNFSDSYQYNMCIHHCRWSGQKSTCTGVWGCLITTYLYGQNPTETAALEDHMIGEPKANKAFERAVSSVDINARFLLYR